MLRTRYPGLSAVEGGHDFGRDVDIYFRNRLSAMVDDPTASLKRMVEKELRVDLVVAGLPPVRSGQAGLLNLVVVCTVGLGSSNGVRDLCQVTRARYSAKRLAISSAWVSASASRISVQS